MKKISIYTVILSCFVFITSFKSPHTSGLINSVIINKLIDATDTFPVPPRNKKMLFYVQRTQNTNTIVYELNYTKDSTLDAKSPVHPYWIRYADQGEIKELSYIQSEYAYGLKSELVDKEKQTFKVNFVSYKKKDIFLIRSKTNHQYAAYISINGKLSRLEKIFAKIEGGTFWVPHITYVEVTGKDLNGKPVSEKIIP